MSVNASGMWLPEMAFSPKLVPLLEEHGARYTVLDDRCHLNVIYPYSPYHFYGIENSSIRVLFRNHTISDDFAFNNFRSEDDAREKVRNIVEEILRVREGDPERGSCHDSGRQREPDNILPQSLLNCKVLRVPPSVPSGGSGERTNQDCNPRGSG